MTSRSIPLLAVVVVTGTVTHSAGAQAARPSAACERATSSVVVARSAHWTGTEASLTALPQFRDSVVLAISASGQPLVFLSKSLRDAAQRCIDSDMTDCPKPSRRIPAKPTEEQRTAMLALVAHVRQGRASPEAAALVGATCPADWVLRIPIAMSEGGAVPPGQSVMSAICNAGTPRIRYEEVSSDGGLTWALVPTPSFCPRPTRRG
jgi:hypothetical protein